jgi:hypothetical protein
MRKILVMGAILVLLLAFGCAGTVTPQRGELAVINKELVRDQSGNVTVRVTVKNVGSVMAELAEVTVNFYDAGKDLVDSSSDSVLNLRPGETWDFNIACQGDSSKVKSYDIETTAGTSSGGL